MPKHEIHIKKEVWDVYNSIISKKTMGKCFHGLHEPIDLMEWNGCHPCGSWSIFQVGKNGFN